MEELKIEIVWLTSFVDEKSDGGRQRAVDCEVGLSGAFFEQDQL